MNAKGDQFLTLHLLYLMHVFATGSMMLTALLGFVQMPGYFVLDPIAPQSYKNVIEMQSKDRQSEQKICPT